MGALELFLADGTSSGVWYCSECKILGKIKEEVDKCCQPKICKYCGKEIEKKNYRCVDPECQKSRTLAAYEDPKRERILEKDWDGWVCEDNSDRYFPSVEEYREWMEEEIDEEDNFLPVSSYVWACKEVPFPGIDAENVLEQVTEEMYEDAYFDLKGKDEFCIAVEKFNKVNDNQISYEIDYSKVIVLDKSKNRLD